MCHPHLEIHFFEIKIKNIAHLIVNWIYFKQKISFWRQNYLKKKKKSNQIKFCFNWERRIVSVCIDHTTHFTTHFSKTRRETSKLFISK